MLIYSLPFFRRNYGKSSVRFYSYGGWGVVLERSLEMVSNFKLQESKVVPHSFLDRKQQGEREKERPYISLRTQLAFCLLPPLDMQPSSVNLGAVNKV